MVHSIEPVPSSFWSLSVDPSYMPPSTSKTEADVEGSGVSEESTTSAPTSTTAFFAWYAGRRSHRRHNVSSVDAGGQNPKRRDSRIGQGAPAPAAAAAATRRRNDEDREDDDAERVGEEDMGDQLLTEPPPAAAVVRWYRLYNRCSGGYLQMYMNDVNARGKYASPLGKEVITFLGSVQV